ncbi:MAG: hypothetical protein A3J79_03330 [Elusimicrobia bacterium RIFOXYB2_FULL_62_6]|nr:MAG: hypothetical protein A3J79_03330 [Elusimicrobia bacterium RIFOXYB2_FULL_62_6]
MKRSLETWLILIALFVVIAGAAAYLTLRRTGTVLLTGDRTARRAHRASVMTGKVASSQAVLAYLRKPGRETLDAALQACLSARATAPEDVFNNFLTAFCYHEAGDKAAEARALADLRPEHLAAYRFSFYEHRADLADALYYLPAYFCVKLREASNAEDSYARGGKCPFFGGPITVREYKRGGRTVPRFICPKCDGMLQLREDEFVGNLASHRVKAENPLVSVLPSYANLLEDRRRSRSDKPGTVAKIVDAIGLREGMAVADIGAGIGQFTFPFAERVGPKGKVYAEDIDEGSYKLLKYTVQKDGIKNIVPLLGTATDMKLPAGALDKAVLIHVYRSIVVGMDEEGPERMGVFFDGFFASIYKALKKDGTLVIVDHLDAELGLSPETIAAELAKRGFLAAGEERGIKGRNFVFFFKKAGPAEKPSSAGAAGR